jgi:hypothetical protein
MESGEDINIGVSSTGTTSFDESGANQWQNQNSYQSKIFNLVYKISGGRLRDKKQITAILLLVAIVFLLLAVYFFSSSLKSDLKGYPPGYNPSTGTYMPIPENT